MLEAFDTLAGVVAKFATGNVDDPFADCTILTDLVSIAYGAKKS